MTDNKRNFFRLWYPAGAAPKFLSGGLVYEVLEISEFGIKILSKSGVNLENHTIMIGSLIFQNGEANLLYGSLLRSNDDTLIIGLKKPLPLRVIRQEELRLLRLFPRKN
ncbi:MAG: hypothetical protein EXR74_06830 [Bdellovibrionales bacterium]|nr:hypothetical protein [Bdellovibrionales bacterium]